MQQPALGREPLQMELFDPRTPCDHQAATTRSWRDMRINVDTCRCGATREHYWGKQPNQWEERKP